MTRRRDEMLVIESSAFDSPLADADSIVDGLAWLDYEVKKWLRWLVVIVAFPPDDVCSTYLKWVRARLDMVGVRTTTRGDRPRERARCRMMWHVRGEGRGEGGSFEIAVKPDRVREWVVEPHLMFEPEVVAAAIIDYAATLAMADDVEPF